MILALMLLAQVGPLVNPGPSTMPLPTARIERRASEKPAPFVPQSVSKLGQWTNRLASFTSPKRGIE